MPENAASLAVKLMSAATKINRTGESMLPSATVNTDDRPVTLTNPVAGVNVIRTFDHS